MQGVIVNFRRGRRITNPYQMIIQPKGCSTRDKALALVGKRVVWKSPAGKELSGTVLQAHGRSGCVRVRFEPGLPGQAIGSEVVIA